MNRFLPKLVISDLDGTLLNNARQIGPVTVTAIKRLTEMNVPVILASGRMYVSMLKYERQLNIHTPLVACNGGEIVEADTGVRLVQAPLSRETAILACEYFENLGMHAQAYIGDDYFMSEHNAFSDDYHVTSGIYGIAVHKPLSAWLADKDDITKILIIGAPPHIRELLPKVREDFSGRLDAAISQAHFIELTDLSANKGAALRRVAAMYNVELKDVLACGDGLNDLPMLKIAGCSVTTANAYAEVQAACAYLARSNDDDGVGIAINELVFGEQQ